MIPIPYDSALGGRVSLSVADEWPSLRHQAAPPPLASSPSPARCTCLVHPFIHIPPSSSSPGSSSTIITITIISTTTSRLPRASMALVALVATLLVALSLASPTHAFDRVLEVVPTQNQTASASASSSSASGLTDALPRPPLGSNNDPPCTCTPEGDRCECLSIAAAMNATDPVGSNLVRPPARP